MQEPGAIIGRSAAVLIAKGESPRTADQIQGIHDAVVNAIGARFDSVDLETHVTVHEVEFLPAFMGPAGETLNQFEHILQTYGHHIKNLVGIVLALVKFSSMFLRMLKKFKPSDAEVQVLDEDDQQLLSGTRSLGSGQLQNF